MNKAIEKVEAYKDKTIKTALERAKEQYQDAKDFYNQTGYDRYYNKMNRLEQEINELEEYQHRDDVILAAIAERTKVKQEIEELKKVLRNKLFYLLEAIPECSEGRSIQMWLEDL